MNCGRYPSTRKCCLSGKNRLRMLLEGRCALCHRAGQIPDKQQTKPGQVLPVVNRVSAGVVYMLSRHPEDTAMKQMIAESWSAVMDNQRNPLRHLDLASQHYFMQVLGWMWSMVFSLSFLSIFEFGWVWLSHLLVFGGMAFTVAVFKEAKKQSVDTQLERQSLSNSSSCVWKLDSEA
jgi:hypothetical protein